MRYPLRGFTVHPTDPTAAIIPLSRGKVAVVDLADAPALARFNWCAVERKEKNTVRWYARRNGTASEKRGVKYYMHREILGVGDLMVDHRDSDGLNNRRSNLRPADDSQNQFNRRKTIGKSKYKGVTWYKPYGKWMVYLQWKSGKHFLGYFDDEVEAAKAYDAFVLKNCPSPEFALINFPVDKCQPVT